MIKTRSGLVVKMIADKNLIKIENNYGLATTNLNSETINIISVDFDTINEFTINKVKKTIIHEICHALHFFNQFYSYYLYIIEDDKVDIDSEMLTRITTESIWELAYSNLDLVEFFREKTIEEEVEYLSSLFDIILVTEEESYNFRKIEFNLDKEHYEKGGE